MGAAASTEASESWQYPVQATSARGGAAGASEKASTSVRGDVTADLLGSTLRQAVSKNEFASWARQLRPIVQKRRGGAGAAEGGTCIVPPRQQSSVHGGPV